MMSAQIIANHRQGAEIVAGNPAACKQKSILLLEQLRLPRGLLPMEEMTEVGYNKGTGFMWLKQRKKREHKFPDVGKITSSFGEVVTAFVEDRRMREVTGFKSKGVLVWLDIANIYVEEGDPTKVTFAVASGLSMSFPFSAFDVVEPKQSK